MCFEDIVCARHHWQRSYTINFQTVLYISDIKSKTWNFERRLSSLTPGEDIIVFCSLTARTYERQVYIFNIGKPFKFYNVRLCKRSKVNRLCLPFFLKLRFYYQTSSRIAKLKNIDLQLHAWLPNLNESPSMQWNATSFLIEYNAILLMTDFVILGIFSIIDGIAFNHGQTINISSPNLKFETRKMTLHWKCMLRY